MHGPFPRSIMCVVAFVLSVATLAPAAMAQREAKKQPARAPKQQAGNSFLWKATSDANTVYLLGSIHVAREDFYPLAAEIERAFEESKILAVEVDVQKVDAAAMQQALLTKGMYQGGGSLADDVSKETLKLFRAHCANKDLPAQQLEMFRPWAVALTLSVMELQAIGFRAELGIDQHFLTKAHGSSKPVIELESAQAQIDLLSGFGKEMEDKFLMQTLLGMKDLRETIEKAATAWKTGDVKSIQEELLEKGLREAPEIKPVFVKLFDERNEKMAEKVDAFLKGEGEPGPYFVVVGAGHMIGKKGMVQLLEDKGYKVERVRVAVAGKKPGK